MKKIYIFCLILLFFLITGCNKKTKNLPNARTEIKNNITSIKNKIFITHPITEDDEINQYILDTLKSICNQMMLNSEVIMGTINYEVIDNDEILSFIFEIDFVLPEKINKMHKIFNFNYEEKHLLIISDQVLQEQVLPLINEELILFERVINYYEVLSINYLINKSYIIFYLNNKHQITIDINKINITSKSIKNNNQDKMKRVVLTFDDGPSNKTLLLLNLLKQYNIKATFFLLGEQAQRYPDFVEEINNQKHEIGNHSYSHRDFSKASLDEIIFEVTTTQEILKNILGYYPQVFRFPYGAYRQDILDFISMPVILWNVDSNDWRNISREEKIEHIKKDLSDQAILLFHDYHLMDLDLMEQVIKILQKMDYEFVTCYEYFDFRNLENFIHGKIYR